MAALESVEESLVGIYNKHKENHTESWDILQFVKSLGLPTTNQNLGLESASPNYAAITNHSQSRYESNHSFNFVGTQQGTSAEVIALTLKVLSYLRYSKNEYFNLETIPALQQQDWHQIGDLAKYLLKKKFVIIKGIDARIYTQITELGLQFLHACEATAC